MEVQLLNRATCLLNVLPSRGSSFSIVNSFFVFSDMNLLYCCTESSGSHTNFLFSLEPLENGSCLFYDPWQADYFNLLKFILMHFESVSNAYRPFTRRLVCCMKDALKKWVTFPHIYFQWIRFSLETWSCFLIDFFRPTIIYFVWLEIFLSFVACDNRR